MSSPNGKRQTETPRSSGWVRPAIEWEEPYEPTIFAASCTLQSGVCPGGARD